MTPDARALLRRCADQGVGLSIASDGVRLSVRWTVFVDDDLRRRLRKHRAEIVDALRERPRGPTDPRWSVALCSDPDLWRAWSALCERRYGGPAPTITDAFAAFLEVRQ